MAGYSKKSLIDKLGIKPYQKLLIINAPKSFQEYLSTGRIQFLESSDDKDFDYIHLFISSFGDFIKNFDTMSSKLKSNGMIWIAWPKKTSGIKTDINENLIRDYVLTKKFVDIKVAAIDKTWSGLKVVIRKIFR